MIQKPLADLTETEMYHPDISVIVFHKVSVAAALKLIASEISVCKYRIVLNFLKRTVDIVGICHYHHMTVFGTAFCGHKIVSIFKLI